MLVNDNVDVACQAIEKAAMDKAALEVDEAFATHFEARRRHREVSLLYRVVFYPDIDTLNSLDLGCNSGTPRFLTHRNTPPSSRTPFASDPWVCSLFSWQFMRISVGRLAEYFCTYVDAVKAPETKRRVGIASRPGSTVSYPNEALSSLYNQTPPEDSIQTALPHTDVMDRFNVSNCCKIQSYTCSLSAPGIGQGSRRCTPAASHPVSGSVATEPQHTAINPRDSFPGGELCGPPAYAFVNVSKNCSALVQDKYTIGT